MPVTHDEVEPITSQVHDNSWSANLEQPVHGEDLALVERQARTAVEYTTPGNHVNLVTHANHGDPIEFLADALESADADVELEYVEQCGCGGHVTRAHIRG